MTVLSQNEKTQLTALQMYIQSFTVFPTINGSLPLITYTALCHLLTWHFTFRHKNHNNKTPFWQCRKRYNSPGGGVYRVTPYIRMIGMIVVFFRGCNRRFIGFFGGFVQAKSIKKNKTGIC